MMFIFGDSHARAFGTENNDNSYSIVRPETGTWYITPIGSSTARGLLNPASKTGARNKIIEYLNLNNSRDKVIVLMFGEVDLTNNILSSNYLESNRESVRRIMEFRSYLLAREDVSHVYICSIVPRTPSFFMNGKDSECVQKMILEWNSLLRNPIDIFTVLLDASGFLAKDWARTYTDKGERHLSAAGGSIIFDKIENHVNSLALR